MICVWPDCENVVPFKPDLCASHARYLYGDEWPAWAWQAEEPGREMMVILTGLWQARLEQQ